MKTYVFCLHTRTLITWHNNSNAMSSNCACTWWTCWTYVHLMFKRNMCPTTLYPCLHLPELHKMDATCSTDVATPTPVTWPLALSQGWRSVVLESLTNHQSVQKNKTSNVIPTTDVATPTPVTWPLALSLGWKSVTLESLTNQQSVRKRKTSNVIPTYNRQNGCYMLNWCSHTYPCQMTSCTVTGVKVCHIGKLNQSPICPKE